MVKLQQYWIYKLSSSRLKRSNYHIQLDINSARKNGEVISIADSQMLMSLRKLKGQKTYIENIAELLLERKKIKRKKYSKENSEILVNIENKLDASLFVPEIVSLFVEDIKHYNYIGKNGFYINDIHYVRLLCGAGQARRNNVLFIDEQWEQALKTVLNNDRKDIEIVPAKYNAYFSLASSASLPVTEPYFSVVPDCEITRKENVEFITEVDDADDLVEEQERDIIFNLFDGAGMISPKMALQWANDLGLDYIPSAFIVRANFIKGLLMVFDFHSYSEEIIGKHWITDVWGNSINLRDQDIILTQSMFKLANAFDSVNDFVNKCHKNELGWRVSRPSPKEENKHCFLNYQFLQVLNLDDKKIETLCQKTLDYFSNIAQKKVSNTLLYLLGKLSDQEYDAEIFDKIHDDVTKSIILNNNMLDDPYVQQHLVKSLNKKIKESYIGNLMIDGFYTMKVPDPVALTEFILGEKVNGLLSRDYYYNKTWLDQDVKKLAVMRAPLTWRSEVNVINLKQNAETDKWYKYLDKCLVYNVFGNDGLIEGGSD